MQALGTTARGDVFQYTDQVAMALLRVIAQRILADQPTGQVHIDMGTGTEAGQLPSLCTGQFVAANIQRFVVAGCHDDFNHGAPSRPATAVAANRINGSGLA
ncbi:hypothetical protein D3C84_917770 [compost metagenome]